MRLNNICNNVAARVLGVPGTMVQEVYNGNFIKEPFEVVGRISDRIELYSRHRAKEVLGCFRATGFKKAE